MVRNDSTLTSRVLTTLDLYGSPVYLTSNGRSKTKSYIGAFLTLCTIGAALGLTGTKFSDYVNGTNPTVTYTTLYGNSELQFNSSNLYMNISFYYPIENLTQSGPPVGINENNYAYVYRLNDVGVNCLTCGSQTNRTKMELCSVNNTAPPNIKSLSGSKSSGIIQIFKKYSFCFPSSLNGTIKDMTTGSSQDTSLQIQLPVIDFSGASTDTTTAQNSQSSSAPSSQSTSGTNQPPSTQPTSSQAAPSPKRVMLATNNLNGHENNDVPQVKTSSYNEDMALISGSNGLSLDHYQRNNKRILDTPGAVTNTQSISAALSTLR